MALTQDLGQFVADLSPNQLPEEAARVARMGFIDPTKDTFAEFRTNDRPGPIDMLNLVRLRSFSGDLGDHDHEIEEARWMPLEQAARELTYVGEREMVQRAISRGAADR